MYNYGLTTTGYSAPTASGSVWGLVWLIVSLVAAVVGGIVLYFTVFADKKEGKYKGTATCTRYSSICPTFVSN